MEPPENPVTQAPKVPRTAERIFSGELTAGRASRMIAAFTLVATRRILPGRHGVRFVAVGGVPGSFVASPWTELGGPPPAPAA
jgi:hypothetical protein